jgi:hypothetical protein
VPLRCIAKSKGSLSKARGATGDPSKGATGTTLSPFSFASIRHKHRVAFQRQEGQKCHAQAQGGATGEAAGIGLAQAREPWMGSVQRTEALGQQGNKNKGLHKPQAKVI